MTDFNKALEVLKIIESKGYSAFIVGGAVRDYLLGVEPKDVDIASNMPIKELEILFKSYDIGKSKDFGIISISYKGSIFEVANFRKESNYSDSRHPSTVELIDEFYEDSNRRDFTINAMAMDSYCEILDYHKGRQDIEDKQIRFVGNSFERITEDSLRILRAIRFSCRLGFNIVDKEAIRLNVHLLNNLSKERIFDELYKMASNKNFYKCILLMKELSVLKEILPEIDIMNKFEHDVKSHPEGGVFEHTLACIKKANSGNPIVNLACLFHDIGKPVTYAWNEDKQKHTYYSHDVKGKDVFRVVANRLKFSNELKDTILYIIENHMRFHSLHKMRKSKVINLMLNKNFYILKAVSYYDDSCRDKNIFKQGSEESYSLPTEINQQWKDIEAIITQCLCKIDNKDIVDGKYIMSLLNLKSGAIIGIVKNKVNNDFLDDKFDLAKLDDYIIRAYKELLK